MSDPITDLAIRCEHLEETNRSIAKQFGALLLDFGEINDTMKRVANVNIQLMRGMKELDDRTQHLVVVEK
jgi:hypothetical protein